MKQHQMEGTGFSISPVGFGTWAMSGPKSPSYWGPQNDADSIRTIRHAVDRGVNWIDTAAVYGFGHAEQVVASALASIPDADRPLIFTKGGLVWDEQDEKPSVTKSGLKKSIKAEAEASLKRLGVERIDLYQMHWPAEDAKVAEYWEAFQELIAEGKIQCAGVSNHSVDQMNEALSVGPVHSVQAPLNLVNQASTHDIIPWCIEHKAGVLVYSPMASGLLTGKYSGDGMKKLDDRDWRRKSPLFAPDNLARVDRLMSVLKRIANDHHTSTSSLAIAWCLDQPGVSGAVVGARSPDQVDGWIDSGSIELTSQEHHDIQESLQ